MKRFFGAAVLALAALFSFHTVSGCVGDDSTPPPGDGDGGGGDGATGSKAAGAQCAAGNECSSGNCADGVCCDSACSGTCERCNLPGSVGRCEAVPDGQDPDSECKPGPTPDAGTGSSDAGDDAETFALPDAGVPAGDDNQCKGTCNGKRACAFAGTERTCGAVFCGNGHQQGRASCDGKGHCLYGVEECKAFACADGSKGCKTTCTGESDCLATHFCDAASSTCKPKLADGSACQSVAQCQSGNCVQNVCCNSVCDIAGGSCTTAGSVGKCRCSACATGPCDLFYRDEDGDGYGDKAGTIANGRAAYGCVGAPPAGFVANKDDCYDGPTTTVAGSVHPNQSPTTYFKDSYTPPGGSPTWDYDCNGIETKETHEFASTATCSYCRQRTPPLIGCQMLNQCASAGQQGGQACVDTIVVNKCITDSQTGFRGTVACGQQGVTYSCTTCAAVNGTTSTVTGATIYQRCK